VVVFAAEVVRLALFHFHSFMEHIGFLLSHFQIAFPKEDEVLVICIAAFPKGWAVFRDPTKE